MNNSPTPINVIMAAIPEPGNDRNRAIAETWMGWREAGANEPLRLFLRDGGYIDDGNPKRFENDGVASGRHFDPSFSIAAAYQMEEAIAQKGHANTYTHALAVVLLESGIPNNFEDEWWMFTHATPEQRSKAAMVTWAKVQNHLAAEGVKDAN